MTTPAFSPYDYNFGDLAKELESNTPSTLSPANWTILRLDGHCFHTYARPFEKPFDKYLSQAMVFTTIDLCKEFNAVSGYTQSDEISLLLPPTKIDPETKEQQPLIFKGRKQKLESLSAGFASVRFNYHISRNAVPDNNIESTKLQKMNSYTAYFDSRAISVASLADVEKVFQWRSLFDCYRNGISALAQHIFGHKKLHEKNTAMKLAMLADTGIQLEDYPPALFYGTFVKKQQIEKACTNFKTGAPEICLRSEHVAKIIPIPPVPADFQDFLSRP